MRESDLISKIKKHVEELRRQGVPIKCLKIHGNQFTERGTPDLHITCRSRSFWVECKVPGEKPTAIQLQRIEEWRAAGATVAVVTSLEEFRRVIAEGLEEFAESLSKERRNWIALKTTTPPT